MAAPRHPLLWEPMKPIQIKPSHKGLLHKQLGVAKDQPISLAQLQAAKQSQSEAERKRAQFAINARTWRKK